MYLLYFFYFLSYNYNGDSMNRESVILTIRNMKDIKKLDNSNIKYINIDIVNIDKEVISYLKDNGKNYLYAESIHNKNGYIYVDYDTFFIAENIINKIISNVPSDLNKIEIAKYLYISLGKKVGYDINSIYEKNEVFNFSDINTINNIWGAISSCKATNQAYCKLYLYLCSLLNIKCDIVTVNNGGYLCNKLTVNNNSLIVDLTGDAPFIEAGFKTRHFANYNDELEMDKKIGYIKDDYNEVKIDRVLKNINHEDEEFVFDFLINTQKVIEINKNKPIELGIIYDILFHKYCPDVKISINNLYINDIYNSKEHFILISYNSNYYSYNYNKKSFIKLNEKELIDNIENDRIGIYLNEKIPLMYKYKEVM